MTLMERGETSESIPTDLLTEIFLRLPSKSIARFRCVSKLWGSMLSCPYFTELFLTMSTTRPRLLFGVKKKGEWLFFSSPKPQNPYKKSLVVPFEFHMKISGDLRDFNCRYASGLFYFPTMQISKDDKVAMPLICNPITGQYTILPKLRSCDYENSFLVFDPIDKQFKVLLIAYLYEYDHRILTLESGNMRWRKIRCPFTYQLYGNEICINGVLYSLGGKYDEYGVVSNVIVCFDVRSEKFKFIDAKCCGPWPLELTLINYKGKIGMINLKYAFNGGFPLELSLWVLEDSEKHEWSKYVYTLWDDSKLVKVNHNLSVAGMTTTGGIVLSMSCTSKPFYVFYFNPERNTLQSVEIQGFGEYLEALEISGRVYAYLDLVEDLNVNDTKQLKSSPLHQGLNIIRKRPRPKRRTNKQPTAFLKNKYDSLADLE